MRLLLASLFFLFRFAFFELFPSAKVQTKLGEIEGLRYRLQNGHFARIFLGVPYAEPPKRFEKPKPVTPWNGRRLAKEFGPSCYPTYPWMMDAELEFSEDCLFLNIMAHGKPPKGHLGYPVIVWIHGGGFEVGTSTIYGFQRIAENFVSQHVVFVTINYRLGPFGFFSTGDDVVPGNLGLWDQIQALRFVKETIADFGGNPSEITVLGGSAGGASISALTMSPVASDLFQRAICLSGSSLSTFAMNERVVSESRLLSRFLECNGPSEKVISCMKNLPIDAFMAAFEDIGPAKDRPLGFRYNMRFDQELFPIDSYERLLELSPNVPMLTLITSAEMGVFIMNILDFCVFDVEPQKLLSYSESDLRLVIKTVAAGVDGLEDELVQFYIQRNEDSELPNSTFYLSRLTQLASDILFNIPMLQEVELRIKYEGRVYVGLEEYFSRVDRDEAAIPGAYHGNELCYLFEDQFESVFDGRLESRLFQRQILDAVVSFSKTG
ncbi:hypothetical protein L596_007050 [Steinernema carpocapsae]|uniref:Carboxylic ester hydrolase n=1 Tax=Steinernema carpocapsae TaxID=34508 RepID=A0A4V6A5W6_STECR|nr:hypothetical protein L596_007050 [Steinernema carpocapsae]